MEMIKFKTEIFGDEIIKAKNKLEVARRIKAFCLAVSEQDLEQIGREQIIEEVN